MKESKYHELDNCFVKAVTQKAILVDHEGYEYWIPKSQTLNGMHQVKGDSVDLEVSEWFLDKEGINY